MSNVGVCLTRPPSPLLYWSCTGAPYRLRGHFVLDIFSAELIRFHRSAVRSVPRPSMPNSSSNRTSSSEGSAGIPSAPATASTQGSKGRSMNSYPRPNTHAHPAAGRRAPPWSAWLYLRDPRPLYVPGSRSCRRFALDSDVRRVHRNLSNFRHASVERIGHRGE